MDFCSKILDKIKEKSPFNENVTEESQIKELGLDSLTVIEILVEMENECNCIFTEEDLNLYELVSVKDLIDAVAKIKSNVNY